MGLEDYSYRAVSRRTALKLGSAGMLAAASQMALLDKLAWAPQRMALAAAPPKSDIQFDIGAFIAPAFSRNGVQVQFGPVFTFFLTADLTRLPSRTDQAILANALDTIEANYAWSPSGVFTFVSYSAGYFLRLDGIAAVTVPRLLSDRNRFALEIAVPSPTDVVRRSDGSIFNNRARRRFVVPVQLERNEVLFTLRSDSIGILADVVRWLQGSDSLNGRFVRSPAFGTLFRFDAPRLMFQQIGLPRQVANANNLPFRTRVNPETPMWMGFADQQTNGSGPASITTFQGNASARLTDARAGDYFDNGSIQHLSHVIQDLEQFYDNVGNIAGEPETFSERVQYMFRSNPIPSPGNADQFTDGGGPSFLPNVFQGTGDARASASGANDEGTHRFGHLQALQRSSRAADGTPVHMRMDGPGFDSLDVPAGRGFGTGNNLAKLQFTVFVPTAEFFRVMRINQASLDLEATFDVEEEESGLERFLTATRRQNFLIPPRRHRAFPLVEFT